MSRAAAATTARPPRGPPHADSQAEDAILGRDHYVIEHLGREERLRELRKKRLVLLEALASTMLPSCA